MLISTNELTAVAGPVINSFKIIEEPDYNQKLQGIFIESSSKILSSLRATVAGRVFNQISSIDLSLLSTGLPIRAQNILNIPECSASPGLTVQTVFKT